MKTTRRSITILIACAFFASAPARMSADAPVPASESAIYARMQQVNANLKSYEAQLHVDITTHSFPFLSPKLDGTAYFKRPDKTAVIFDTVPALASQFKKVYPQLEQPSEWPELYDVTPVSDDGTNATFKLVRKKNGRIDHVDVIVDDKSATVTSMIYYYKDDGGSIGFSQSYAMVDGNYVIVAQRGKIDIPHYKADVVSSFTNYKINVTVPDSVFAE